MKKYYSFHIIWNDRSTTYGKNFPHNVEGAMHICGKVNDSAQDGYFIFSDEVVSKVL